MKEYSKETKYMTFSQYADTGKTLKVMVRNRSSGFRLGFIRWYPSWRCYTFMSSGNCVFNSACLQDIRDVIAELETLRDERRSGASK